MNSQLKKSLILPLALGFAVTFTPGMVFAEHEHHGGGHHGKHHHGHHGEHHHGHHHGYHHGYHHGHHHGGGYWGYTGWAPAGAWVGSSNCRYIHGYHDQYGKWHPKTRVCRHH